MKRGLVLAAFAVAVILLVLGLIFLCAGVRQPSRLLLGLVLLVVGGGVAAWAGFTFRRMREQSPGRLADRITALAERSGQAEVSLSEAVAELSVSHQAVQAAMDLLTHRGVARPEQRGDKRVYAFPGLRETRVVRRCPYCGSEFSVKTALHTCPKCGGDLELVKE